ncbi:MAG: hypothetical protein K9J16_02340 [Melioribacteraceae bacterium]|nr:hypothetical protein [Melioribacteraceae bacterium]MCF8353737.1 hypothetical protein [Melioribacteraceae bacterium]MCF8392454.1 hypothetical protein [Melioribacteraceae bacterium]MCF8418365.1 hypothetical protein [Melioribacteraceae bacterium]
MKIGANPAGNYSPFMVNKTAAVKNSTKTMSAEKSGSINENEKSFFKNLYPEQSSEIDNYHFYSKGGSMSGVSVGSLLDRRG